MQVIHKNMGPPGLITPGYNLVSTWAHFSLPARPLCRQALIVAMIFHTSLYLHLAVLCHSDVRLGYVTCFGQGLSNIPDAKERPSWAMPLSKEQACTRVMRSLGKSQVTWAEDILEHPADWRHMSKFSQDQPSPAQGKGLPLTVDTNTNTLRNESKYTEMVNDHKIKPSNIWKHSLIFRLFPHIIVYALRSTSSLG